jgi:hypothetical protein
MPSTVRPPPVFIPSFTCPAPLANRGGTKETQLPENTAAHRHSSLFSWAGNVDMEAHYRAVLLSCANRSAMLLGASKTEKGEKKLPAYSDPPPPPSLHSVGTSRKSPAAWTVPRLLQADSSAKRLLAAAALYRVRRRLQPGVVCTELAASGPSTSSRPTSFSKSERAFYSPSTPSSRAPARSSTALPPGELPT